MNAAKCRSCGAPIVWCKTERGKAIPLDAEPTEAGMFYLDDSTGVAFYGRGKLSKGHTSHFATCPNSAQHRKAR